MSEKPAPPVKDVFDRSVKLLFQIQPAVVCRLAGINADPPEISFENTAVNIPELRADHLFRIQRAGTEPCALHLEYQLDPEAWYCWFYAKITLQRRHSKKRERLFINCP